jgi:hypothetical protein
MANTKYISVIINNQVADLDDDAIDAIQLTFALEDPENWQGKQAAYALDLSLPATKTNDGIFNQFSNPNIEDMTTDGTFRETMDISVTCNGIIVFKGKMILTEATSTDKPEKYTFNAWANNGDWLINGQNLTLWDCVPTGTSHTFDVATAEASWTHDGYESGVLSNVLSKCYVYAPVRYRQPFDNGDFGVNLYHLRPSLFILPLLYRGFQQMGYAINSQFFGINGNTLLSAQKDYTNRLVLPWTFGDFYDITSQLTNGLGFKAYGTKPAFYATPLNGQFYPGTDPATSDWMQYNIKAFYGSGVTIFDVKTDPTTPTINSRFVMGNTDVPEGYDNFGLYSFDETTGTMKYSFNVPQNYSAYITATNTLNFTMSFYIGITNNSATGSGHYVDVQLLAKKNGVPVGGFPVSILPHTIPPGENYPTSSSPISGEDTLFAAVSPTTYKFSVSGVASGDVLEFNLQVYIDANFTDPSQYINAYIMCAGYINANPNSLNASSSSNATNWGVNSLTGQWQNYPNSPNVLPYYSTFIMNSLQLVDGQGVNFQQYDNLRNYKFFDLLRGLVDLFNLEIQTDPINKVVTIEPMFPVTVKNPYDSSDINFVGYFRNDRILDYSSKMDWTKESRMLLFNSCERQIDFNFKQDGSDGGQNIYAARYKGVYLNNTVKPKVNTNLAVENSIISGVPGAARYVLPNRFSKGNKQMQNAFFSATMHYRHQPWANYTDGFVSNGGFPPQLITIFPENINDSSASAVTATFEPKIAFYHGQTYRSGFSWYFPWEGLPLNTPIATAFPLMYSVFYNNIDSPNTCPVLTYCDQKVLDNTTQVVRQGLVRLFHLQRLATMRNGQLYEPFLRLNLTDITNWEHRESLIINTAIYALINIDNFKPASDESTQCTMWKIAKQMQTDLDNLYPSTDSLNYNAILSQYDLKYAQLLLFQTDIPQV